MIEPTCLWRAEMTYCASNCTLWSCSRHRSNVQTITLSWPLWWADFSTECRDYISADYISAPAGIASLPLSELSDDGPVGADPHGHR